MQSSHQYLVDEVISSEIQIYGLGNRFVFPLCRTLTTAIDLDIIPSSHINHDKVVLASLLMAFAFRSSMSQATGTPFFSWGRLHGKMAMSNDDGCSNSLEPPYVMKAARLTIILLLVT
jgi:hypothetical protein